MRIDHVIYATEDLEAAAGRIHSELGLEAVIGGRHEGHGTHNRIVPLGAGYLELMAIADPEEAVAIAREGLTARLVGVGEALRQPSLPFFIERDGGVRDPGEAGDAGGITWLEVAGDAGALSPLLGGADLPVRMVPGPAGVRAMGIGDRELRNA